MESILESHGPCESFELSVVQIGLETTKLRYCGWGQVHRYMPERGYIALGAGGDAPRHSVEFSAWFLREGGASVETRLRAFARVPRELAKHPTVEKRFLGDGALEGKEVWLNGPPYAPSWNLEYADAVYVAHAFLDTKHILYLGIYLLHSKGFRPTRSRGTCATKCSWTAAASA